MIKIIAAGFIALAVAGCATERRNVKVYKVGDMLSAPPGGTLLSVQGGWVEKVRRWVGVPSSPENGWQEESRYSIDYLRKELIYGGASGTIINLDYREYRAGFAAPVFFENLKFDLKDSQMITFQNFRFEVLGATNSGMTARLISDR